MPTILGANTLSTGYDVANSLRFNDGSSDYLSQTISSSTGKTFTISFWMKKSTDGSNNCIFGLSSDNNSNDYIEISTKSGSYGLDIQFNNGSGGTYLRRRTNRVFRDTSAWMHVVVRFDSTQGTASNRFRLYINGVQETSIDVDSSAADVPQDYVTDLATNGATLNIGRMVNASNYFDGYLCEVVLVDGSSLAPTSFGEFDANSPTIWKPIDVSGLTFGTNGFYLEFKQSGTSQNSSGLGADTSGQDNHFAVNNLTAVDQSTDTCTNNFATMNPLDNYYGAQTYSNGNLQINSPSGNASAPHSTIGVSSGRWYVEAKLDSAGSNQTLIGISSNQATQTDYHTGRGATSYGMYSNGGKIYNNNDSGTSYGDGYSAGNIIGIYLDLEDNKLYFSVNGTLQNSGTGHTIAAASTTELGFYFFSGMQWDNQQSCQWSFNFGSPTYANSSSNTDDNGYGDFEYSPNITGDGSAKKFYALNSKNLAEFG